jgi:hypothetical protein
MNKLGLAQVLAALVASTILGALPACYGEGSSHPDDVAEASSAATESAIVGKWQFVYTESARRGYEARLASEIEDRVELAKAKLAGETEAAQSQIEFTEEGEYLSWVLGELIFQAPYRASALSKEKVQLSMKAGDGEKTTTVTLNGADEIVIDDPKKGPLTFRRVK